ncbi:MAG: TonB C-terminal domain-containing protein [Heliobacteriaceae bacterium]|nr:TonB C-terminal domain-containing protein [Heliobacteriaceae bacterium]
MMKKFFLFVFCLLFANCAMAGYVTVTPDVLNANDTPNYGSINYASQKVFTNIPDKLILDLGNIPPVYQALTQNYKSKPGYNSVDYKFAELNYNVPTGELDNIQVKKLLSPQSWAVYNYPSGDLRCIYIVDGIGNSYFFNAQGRYINFASYKKNIINIVTANFNATYKFNKWDAFWWNIASPDAAVALTLDRGGNVIEASVVQSSGFKAWDKKILFVAAASGPYGEFPQGTPFDVISIKVKIAL